MRDEVKEVSYGPSSNKLEITVKTDKVLAYNPVKNPKYWQDICQIIENHIKEVE